MATHALHGNAYAAEPHALTPEQKLEVAIGYLESGAPGEARRRIRALVTEDRYGSAEVAYHWVLALLSGRTLTSLGGGDVARLEHAFAMAERHAGGRWWRCVDTIRALVNALLVVGPDGQPDPRGLGAALRAYASLPDVDRFAIERHLSLALSGVVRDHVEDLNAEHVRISRGEPGRLARVPKFFEPDPAEPVVKTARPAPAQPTVLPLAGGGLLSVAGLALLALAAAETHIVAGVAVFVLVAGGGYAIVRQGVDRAFRRSRQAAEEAEFSHGTRAGFLRPAGDTMRAGFADATNAMIDTVFGVYQPREQHLREAFWQDTRGLRKALHGDLIDLYGVRGVRAGAVRWLVHHHADDIACRWREGTLDDFRRPHRPPTPIAGIVALAAAAIVLLWAMSVLTLYALALAAPLLWFGTRLVLRGGLALFGERRRIALDSLEFQRRWAGECAAWQRWVDWLADRPTDAEMGRWLSLDLALWKREVMSEYRLTNRDILTHLTLTEAAPRGRHARYVGGPYRHSAYTVLLFLLTEGGVRQVQARLDFATGTFSAIRRTTFRYSAIGSVRVTEVGRGRQAFQLGLISNQTIEVLLDDFAGEPLEQFGEDAEQLAELASDAAGVTSALRVLEAVAADGRDWIALERQRLYRRMPRQQRMPTAQLPR
ncbi:hypothetical protein OHA21_06730 [Actinoplanes sp. NBC_00393]|uniref:hypothetical protein n=1 Tax=Actinoplanes sp. NBC_00393 TaxID=2975953 RepID=UPI002E20BDCA